MQALLLGALFAIPVHAQDDGTPEDEEAAEGSELQQIQARRRALFQQMLADPTNLDVAFEYAGLSARAGDVEAAIATLERMLIFAPGLPRLQLELGVFYYRLGADETARYYFESALAAPDVPDVVRARVDPYLAAIDRRTAGYTFSGTFVTGLRYQTNANTGPGGTIIIQGLPFELDDAATGQPDYNSFLTGNVTYSHDLQSQGDRFNVNLVTYGAWYEARDEINTALAELRAGPVYDLQRFDLENTYIGVHGIAGGVALGEEPYLGAAGAGASFSTLVTPRTQLVMQGDYRREEYLNSSLRPTAADRSGHRVTGSARLQHQLVERFSIFAVLQGERRETRRDYLDMWEWGVTAGWILAIESPNPAQREPWVVGLTGGYRDRDFDAPDPTINPDASERDEELLLVGTITMPMRGGWALQGQGGYREVMSNYDIRAFDNVHGSLGLLKRF